MNIKYEQNLNFASQYKYLTIYIKSIVIQKMKDNSSTKQQERPFYQITPYIGKVEAENIKQYKYFGGDTGFLYRFFYSPLADKIVTYLPESLA